MALRWELMFLCHLQSCVNGRDGEPYSTEELLVPPWSVTNGISVIELGLSKSQTSRLKWSFLPSVVIGE